SAPRRQPRPAERHQGPRVVPARRADRARRARGRDLRGSAAQPAHAVHARGAARLARAHSRRRARRRLRARADRRRRAGAAARRAAAGVREAERRAGAGQHELQHGGTADGGRAARCRGGVRLCPDRRARARSVPGAAVAVVSALFDVVVPSIGRPSLARLLAALARASGPPPGRIVVVDDRPAGGAPLPLDAAAAALPAPLLRLASAGRGPAAARNRGWRACEAPWVAFLDDDVVPERDWLAACAADLARVSRDVAGSQGRIVVPSPAGRRPDDWERSVMGLAGGAWITADMAYRREVLAALGGFDERFRRAWREDSELALRVQAAGHRLVRGGRRSAHPIGPRPPLASLRAQAGNADDVLVAALHGRDWRARAGAPRGRLRRHAIVTAAAALALAA